MVTVTNAAPSAPSPFILFTCEDHGSSGSFTYGCLALGYSPAGASVSWKKDDKQLTTGVKDYPAVFNKLGTYTRSSELTITEAEAGRGDIFCVVQHDQKDYVAKVPDREVHHPTITITISALDEIKRSRKAIAVCLVNDFTPAKFTVNWLKNGEPLDSGIVTSPAFQVNGNGNFSATSQLTFPATEWFKGSVYTCQVNHEKDLKSQNISRSPVDDSCGEPKITILPPPVEQELMEMTVTLTCRVSGAPYGIKVSWNHEKVHLESEIQPTGHADIVERKVNISTRDWLSGDDFECVVSHDDMPTPKTEQINWKKGQHLLTPSVSVLLPPTEEISAHKTITLTCFVRGFSPRRVFVTWTLEDKRVDESMYKNTEVEAENGNDTFFTYSLLSIGAEEWASGASFSCLVGHEAIPMKTIVRTVNKFSGKPSFVNVSLVLMDTVNSYYADKVPLEDYEEDRDNIWTTASTFIILFFLSISYGAAVTLVKAVSRALSSARTSAVIHGLRLGTCGDELGDSNVINVLSHESMKPSKLKIHLESCHSNLARKGVDYFKPCGLCLAAAPSAPSPFILFTCEDHGSSGSFTYGCLALGYSPAGASVSWKKDDKQLTTGVKDYPAVFNKLGTYTRSSELTITEAEAGRGDIFCVVQHNQKDYVAKVPDREVHHPTVTITISALEEIKRSRKAIAVCLVNDFTPAKFTVNWLKNGESLDSGIVTSPAFQVNSDGNFSATSQLTFPATEWFKGSVYTCQVNHGKDLKSQNISRSPDDDSCGEPKITILPPPVEQELMEMTVTLTCRVSDAPYDITVSWNHEKVHLESEIQPTGHADIVESKVNISTRDWLSGDYFECLVSHDDMPTPKTGRINWKKGQHLLTPSVSVLLPPTEEISAHKTITLTCFVRGFSPRRVFVTWTLDDKRVDESKYKNTEVEAENGNDTFFTYSLLSIGAEEWASGTSFSCLVGHEAIPMKTIVRTVNKSSGKPSFVNVSLVLMDTVNSCQ
ncbi:uncharacterized protein LOC116974745 [Amblyraja radiata]|uniref:uncharacterized protein LOC116974745 n=1 Tax=Amblyraja radiata TaxID=386614 RepID=UPI001401D972|nr:uncharacterized protein LOC116974745 [Amblyraja radiata]